MIELEIDGRKIEAQEGSMIIEAADNADIYIPRFCYHKKLSIAANCRMCLIEVEKARKPLPACATPVTSGMKVYTRSKLAVEAQRIVMEFLLINHPLDCPICDQGGECELQDLAVGFGRGISRYTEGKRSVKDENLGPLIGTEMTRCIHCTRCVRFGQEVAGMPELGATDRGENMRIGTFVEQAVRSEVSGNIIDLCPVGALTNKPFRFRARAWEMQAYPSVAPHDCLGSNIYLHTRGKWYIDKRDIMRVVPRENENINETWLSDRDRWSYEALKSPERAGQPLAKRGNEWQPMDWETALTEVVSGLHKTPPQEIGALISPNATVEECYLLQKWLRGINCHNIDHRLRQTDFRDQQRAALFPGLTMPISDLEKLDAILLVGSNIRHEQPLASLRLRKMALEHQGHIMCLNPVDYEFNFPVDTKLIAGSIELIHHLAGVLKALLVEEASLTDEFLKSMLSQISVSDTHKKIAKRLKEGNKTAILLGSYALNHPMAAIIKQLAQLITNITKGQCGYLTDGANTAGAWISGAIPHRTVAGQSVSETGLNAFKMFADNLSAYILVNVEPEFDSAYPALALQALSDAKTVIVLTSFVSDQIKEYADIILPIAPFTETEGTYINAAGDWQTVPFVSTPYEESRPAWKVLRVLGNLFRIEGFEYTNAAEILLEVKQFVDQTPFEIEEKFTIDKLPQAENKLQRIPEWPLYRTDSLVRRARSLQATLLPEVATIRIHPDTANAFNLAIQNIMKATQKHNQLNLPLVFDESIAKNHVYIPAALSETAGFGEAFGTVELQQNETSE